MALDTVIDKTKLESAMTATANAIRTKTGGTDSITWDTDNGFADAVSGLTTEELNPPGVIPAGIKAAAMEIVRKVEEVRKNDSIVFLAMSDSHHTGQQSDTGWQTLTNLGNLHAGMAAKVLSFGLDLDFVCHLGDITFGHGTTTSQLLHQQIGEMNLWLDEAWKGIPRFQTVGNHDTGMYAVSNGTESNLESNEYLFSVFGKYCEGTVYGSETYGYCYRDFESKKLRVICLNTSEGDSLNASYECSPAQLLWFAQTLKSVGAMSGWNVLVLGHYPLDFPGMHDASAVVKAYVEGNGITVNGTAVNFSGSNLARFIANFHGHTHCFKVARLNELNTSAMTATEYDAWRVGIPNSGFYRSNHQEGPNAYGLYFEEETTYDKVNDGVNDTAFVVNVITPSEEVIHSFCYGAGYDRAIGYGAAAWYKITSSLINCTMEASVSSVAEGKAFTATIRPKEHCQMSSVVITMGGVDITASCYSEGQITIAAVTGDVEISAKAIMALACVNQLPISTDASGAVYNGKGYKEDTYLSVGAEGSRSGVYCSGFIPIDGAQPLYFLNCGIQLHENHRFSFYDETKTHITNSTANTQQLAANAAVTMEWDSEGNLTKLVHNGSYGRQAKFVRFCCGYLGEDSVVTVNEPIRFADQVDSLVITNDLTNVTTSNSAITIDEGSAYTATLTANSGFTLETVTVTMGGVDITSTAYSNGVVTIPSVTGNVVIAAYASADSVSYTNQIPISIDSSGNPFGTNGLKSGYYLSSGNEGAKSGYIVTGFIPITQLPATVRLKDCGFDQTDSYCRVCSYDSNFTNISTWKGTNLATAVSGVFDENGMATQFTISASASTTAYIRICGDGLTADSIVTVNEPIT